MLINIITIFIHMNKNFITKLFEHNRTGTIIDLLNKNIHLWSYNDIEYVFDTSIREGHYVIFKYMVDHFQLKFYINEISFCKHDLVYNQFIIIDILKRVINVDTDISFYNLLCRSDRRLTFVKCMYSSVVNKINTFGPCDYIYSMMSSTYHDNMRYLTLDNIQYLVHDHRYVDYDYREIHTLYLPIDSFDNRNRLFASTDYITQRYKNVIVQDTDTDVW
jgi:hypothetical protein